MTTTTTKPKSSHPSPCVKKRKGFEGWQDVVNFKRKF